MWLIVSLLALYPLSYYGQFGGQKTPSIVFPWDTLIAVGIGIVAFAWGVASGFDTDEIKAIIETAETAASTQSDLVRPPAGPESGG